MNSRDSSRKSCLLPFPLKRLLALLSYIYLVAVAHADANVPILTGHSVNAEDLVSRVDDVFTAEITKLGPPSIKSEGQTTFWRIKFVNITNRKGLVRSDSRFLLMIDDEDAEAPPQLNKQYVFFAKSEPPFVRIVKVEEASSANLSKIKPLLVSAPKH